MNILDKIKRSIKHGSRIPYQYQWLNKSSLAYLEEITAKAEVGHSGEIRLVIERSLPIHLAWNLRIRERAIDLFSHLRIWDTETRSGVLVYVNLTENRLELVADRGIDAVVEQPVWQRLCDEAILGIRQGKPVQALETLLNKIAAELREHYGQYQNLAGNQLSNMVMVI